MASLMENLIRVLGQEGDLYEALLQLSSSKTPVIVSGNLEELAQVTEKEQELVARITGLEKERTQAMKDIATVLNKDVETLKLTDLIRVLEKRPTEQRQLAAERDRLQEIADNVRRVNDRNQELLKSSLEMVQYEMNILQSGRKAPETANYTRAAGTAGEAIGVSFGGFDAKQ